MALVTISNASLDTSTGQFAPQVPGLFAGEDILLAAPCYIKSSDGKLYMSNGTAANEAAEVVGFAGRHAHAGEPVTLFGIGTRFRYGSGLTPGDIYYLGATAGRLDTAPTTGDAFGYAAAVSSTDIIVIRGQPVLTSATVGAGTITATELANDAVTTAKILNANVTQAKIEVGAAGAGLTGLVVKFAADANVIGALSVTHRILVASGANGDVDVTLTHKTRVTEFRFVLKGAGTAGSTLTLKNGANAISDAIDCSGGGDRDVFRCGEIDDAQHEIAAGGTLRISKASTGGDFPGAEAYVIGLRVA